MDVKGVLRRGESIAGGWVRVKIVGSGVKFGQPKLFPPWWPGRGGFASSFAVITALTST